MVLARVAPEKLTNPISLPTSTLGFTTRDGGLMAHEEWRDVVGYEGLYEVSNLGRVRGVERHYYRQDSRGVSYPVVVRARMLNQTENSNGYYRVSLSRDNHVKQAFVHRLVAMAFVENPDNLPVIDHIDGDRHNNDASNLRWCTQGDNLHYTYQNGREMVFAREHIRKRQVHAVSRPVIRSDGKEFPSVVAASRALGLTDAAVSHVVNGRAKTAGGYSFTFKD